MSEKNIPKIRFPEFTDAWEQRKCEDIFDKVAVPVKVEEEELYREIGIRSHGKGIFHKDEVTGKELGNKRVFWVEPNCFVVNIVFAWERAVAKTTENENGMIASHRFPMYKPKAGIVDLDYITKFFTTNKGKELLEMASPGGAGRNRTLGQKEFANSRIWLPSYEEQKKIGLMLNELDSLITLHQRKCDKTIEYKKGCLQKMFPKDRADVPEIRFPGFTDAWEQRKLSDLIIEYKETVDSECTLPVLTSSKTEGVVLQEEHFGRVQNHDITGYNILPRNYCTYRNRSDGVDFTFNINRCCDKGIISKFYPVFYGNNSDIFFISMVLNYCDEVVHEIAYTCTGTGQKVLSFLDLQKMNIRVPSYDEQKKISQYFEQLDNLITLHQRKCDKYKELKKGLLQQMFV
ncbi:MAG: restriction endonuclease subunit S [Lachnospiraceae bacterium]|nr:restriction endonuclease subunit S [Lachnospiraceae bacterium]